MIEIYQNIKDEVKDVAQTAWNICIAQSNPAAAAEFLNNTMNYYRNIYTEEEMEFMQFFINWHIELMKLEMEGMRAV